MNIQTVARHISLLKNNENFKELHDILMLEVVSNIDRIKMLSLKDYKFRLKAIMLEWCIGQDIDIKYKELNLLHFISPMFNIYTLDLVKLDAWLYNKLLDECGYEIHNMSGMEKLEKYVQGNKSMMRWVR